MTMAPVGYSHGIWLPSKQLSWCLDDAGALYGAIAVERLRTINGDFPASEFCYRRFQESCRLLRCNTSLGLNDWHYLLTELLSKNEAWFKHAGDASAVVVASPGLKDQHHPTLMLYLESLPMATLQKRYASGVPLVLSQVRNIPQACWPSNIKTRSRLHYYLADAESQSFDSDALALLLDIDGLVTDTSVASVLVKIDTNWYTPPLTQVLPSTTLMLLEDQCQRVLNLQRKRITREELFLANEILLLGSTGILHAASSLDISQFGGGKICLEGIHGVGYQAMRKAIQQKFQFAFPN